LDQVEQVMYLREQLAILLIVMAATGFKAKLAIMGSTPSTPDIEFSDSDDFTVACWVKPDTSIDDQQAFVSKICQVGGYGWALALNGLPPRVPDNKFVFMIYSLGSSPFPGWEAIYSDIAITSSAWHHVAVTRNGADTKTSILYVDGVAQADTMTRTLAECSEGLTISKWFSDGVVANRHTLSGSIDEVALWDRVLPASSILSLYNSGVGARADSIIPPPVGIVNGDWSTGTNKKIGTYGVGQLDRVANYVSCSWDSNIDFDHGDPFSWSIWVKPTDLAGQTANNASPAVITKETYMNPTGFTCALTEDGKVWFGLTGGGSGTGYLHIHTTNTNQVNDNTWAHLVFTYDGSNLVSGFKIYVDGAEPASTIFSSSPAASVSMLGQALTLGKRGPNNPGAAQRYLKGYLDDFSIWNVELDSGAVLDLYNSGSADKGALESGVSSSALQGYWDFENPGPGSTTISGSRGLDATMMGGMDGGIAATTGSLLLYYDFEIGNSNPVSGNFPTSRTIYDVDTVAWKSPTMHTGTMTIQMNPADFGAWGQGKLGKYSFLGDGVDDYISIASASQLPLGKGAGDMSVAAWCKQSDTTNWMQVVTRGVDWSDMWGLGKDGTGKMQFGVGGYGQAKILFDEEDTWTHFVGTYNNSLGKVKIYKNGVEQAEASHGPNGVAAGDVRIGGHSAGGYEWYGNLDEVSMWDGVLDTGSIDSLASGSKANAITTTAGSVTPGDWVTGTTGSIADSITSTYSVDLGNGTDDYIPIDDLSGISTELAGLAGFSIAGWFWTDSFPASFDTPDAAGLFSAVNSTTYGGGGGYNAISAISLHLRGHSNPDYNKGMVFQVMNGYDAGARYVWAGDLPGLSPKPGLAGQWNHVAAVYDGTLGPTAGGATGTNQSAAQKREMCKIYINGIYREVAGTPPGAYDIPNTTAAEFVGGQVRFGKDLYGQNSDPTFDGKLDQMAIWNVPLSASDVRYLFSGTLAPNAVSSSNLISYWSMDADGPGSTNLVDSSANGFDGTLTNMNAGAAAPAAATLSAYLDMECDGPGSTNVLDLSGNSLSGTLTNPDSGSCG